jgi:glycosyltransferase involved in cell wall biosynthesis
VASPAPEGVCLLSSSYPSPAAPTRGAFVEDIALGLAERMPVSVVAPLIYPDDPAREARKGIPVARFRFGSGGRLLKEYGGTPLGLMVRYMAAGLLACLPAARRHRAVFAHWVLPAGVIGAAAAFLTRRPLLLYAHGSDICVYAEKSGAYRALARATLARAVHVFAASRDIAARLERLGVPPGRVSVVPCGVDTGVFFPDRAAPATDGPVRLLYVGDLVPPKGVEALVAAAITLAADRHPLRLDLVGDGPLRAGLEARVAAAGAEDAVTFHGARPRAEVADRMRGADALVLPSHNEGTPVSVMEALTCGIPVVATDVGGIPELVTEGANGLLVPPRDQEALTAALARLADDGALRRHLTEGAAATGDRFALEARRAEVLEVVGRVLGPGRAAP